MTVKDEMQIANGSGSALPGRILEAMNKPAPRQALAMIASGRVKVMLGRDLYVYLDEIDGQKIRDRGRMMSIAGSWPLYRAGMIDERCAITEAGRALLDQVGEA